MSGNDPRQSAPVSAAEEHNEGDDNNHNNNNTPAEETTTTNSTDETEENVVLDPYSVIKRVQCPTCSRPLRVPLRLPCGNTLCRACLPPVTKREGISYPRDEGREDGFMCPWKDRGCKRPEGNDSSSSSSSAEHSLGDCGVDVTVGKIVEVLEKVLEENSKSATVAPMRIKWEPSTTATDESLTETKSPPMAQEAVLHDGGYVGIYNLMKEGNLPYDIENVTYENIDSDTELPPAAEIDNLVFQQLKTNIRNELE